VEHVEQWQRQPEAAGASAETRRALLVRLRTALNVALQRNHVTRNVAELVSGPGAGFGQNVTYNLTAVP
jgi:hypothetical protein